MAQVLGEPIAYGRTAEIYAWQEGQVLKLFYDWFTLENIQSEAQKTRAIHAIGLPVPEVGEIIRVNGRYGLIYQRADGDSLFKIFQRRPWNILGYARRMAQLQVRIHARASPADLPSQRETLKSNILHATALTRPLRGRVLAVLATMPDGDRLCHGDFHPGNILATKQGDIIIDWIHACAGNPLADLARTTNLTLGLTDTAQVDRPFLSFGSSRRGHLGNSLFQVFCRICYPAYLHYYFRFRPGGEEEYHRWLPIVAAARLSDGIPELETMLIQQVESNL